MLIASTRVPAGAKVIMGRPRIPFPSESFAEIAKLLEQFPRVVEAHLPMCLIPGLLETPRQVLVLCLHEAEDESPENLLSPIRRKWPEQIPFEVWVLNSDSPFLQMARETGVALFLKK